MKVNELKKVLKPLIKQCIQEVMLEEGYVSKIVSETIAGMNNTSLVKEEREPAPVVKKDKNVDMARKKLLDSIGRDSYNGVNIFENVEPMPQSATSQHGAAAAISSYSPSDAGVDISSIPGMNNWGLLASKGK